MIYGEFVKFYGKKFIINTPFVGKLWNLVGMYLSIASTMLQKFGKKFVLELSKNAKN
jgi:H+/gluconate symporter-like permease